MNENVFATGACTCEQITYHLTQKPLFKHCCHCTWCQKETGSAFVLNAMIESSMVISTSGEVAIIKTPSNSGRGQYISRCPSCHVALWSTYGGLGAGIRFVRVGTLNSPSMVPPDIHIFTSTKLPWLSLQEDIPIREGYYDRQKLWSQESLERLRELKSS